MLVRLRRVRALGVHLRAWLGVLVHLLLLLICVAPLLVALLSLLLGGVV